MKRFLISLFPLALAAIPLRASMPCDSTIVADTARTDSVVSTEKPPKYVRYTERWRRDWSHIIPNQSTGQFAGSIGVYSIGVGWHYGRRDRWETEILFGYLPKKNGSDEHFTATLKQRFIPWHIDISSRWSIEPLTTGLFVSSIFGEGFWKREPSKYTTGYYGFSTKLRYNIFVGQRICYDIPTRHRRFHRAISFYYELSTCDLYLVSAIPNKRFRLGDMLSLALGVKMDIF